MTWQPIDNAGYLLEQNDLPQDTEGIAHAQAFLHAFAPALVRATAKFYDVVENLPLDGERQVLSVVLPAMNKIAKAVYVEQPIRRKKPKQKGSAGRIDYWVYYQEYVFLIELKLAWISVKPHVRISKDARSLWAEALGQLQQISRKKAKKLAMHGDKVLKIAMLLAPGYQWSQQALAPLDQSTAFDLHQRLLADLTLPQPPNWNCMWALAPNLQTYKYSDGSTEVYPGLGIITRVMPLNYD